MVSFSPTAESFGVLAQIGSGVVRGGPEVRFHQGSTRVPRGFHLKKILSWPLAGHGTNQLWPPKQKNPGGKIGKASSTGPATKWIPCPKPHPWFSDNNPHKLRTKGEGAVGGRAWGCWKSGLFQLKPPSSCQMLRCPLFWRPTIYYELGIPWDPL